MRPQKLEDALNDIPKYNPSHDQPRTMEENISNARQNLNQNRAKKRMMALNDSEEVATVHNELASKHSAESAMMDEIFNTKPKLNSNMIGGGDRERNRVGRRSRDKLHSHLNNIDEIIKNTPKVDLDDDDVSLGSVSSVSSVSSSVSQSRGGRKRSPRIRIGSSKSSEQSR